jgi:hypothetical protein
MRTAALTAVRVVLIAGPTVVAFFDGGYFTGARLVAAIGAWVLVGVAALVVDDLVPRGPALAALAGLAGLVAFTALSIAWAPLSGPAQDSAERGALYLGTVVAAWLVFRPREWVRVLEPALAAGILIVIGYGLAGRVLPGIVELERTISAGGRLDQPLTYWNGEGALAALGVVLCARIAGDRARPLVLRAAAAAAAAPLGLGVYLTFSRGALTALAVGLAVLIALTPTLRQLRAVAIAVEGGVALAIVSSLLPSVEDAGDSAGEGAVMLVVLLLVSGLAAAAQMWSARAEDEESTRMGPLRPAVRTLAWVAAGLLVLAPFVAAAADRGDRTQSAPAFGAGAERFATGGSNRIEYWEAAVKAFADDPAVGGGAGSFAVSWLEHRGIDETVRDAHSLELETAAELGVIGLLLLGLMLGGFVAAARRVAQADPGLVAGPIAALAVWAAHSAIDWDWELPALTLVVAVLGGALLARAQAGAELGEQPALAAQRDPREDRGEHDGLGRGLPGLALTAPQHEPYGQR